MRSTLEKIDAHCHLWDLNLNKHSWLTEKIDQGELYLLGNYQDIRKSYLIKDYLHDIKDQSIVKSVHIQAGWSGEQPAEETKWLQKIANKHGYPHGIVAYADLSNPDLEKILTEHCQYKNMRGIRQILRWHDSLALRGCGKNYLEDKDWQKGYALLAKYNLSFDMLIYPHQMEQAATLAKKYPEIPIIINHTGMPINIYPNSFDYWKMQLAKLATQPNVSIKISGFGMLNHSWSIDSIKPYIKTTVDLFGVDRCMFASNFPVDGLYSDLDVLYNSFSEIVADMMAADRHKLFYENAVNIYRL